METYSSPAQIAEVVYEAATEGKISFAMLQAKDAKATYAMRLQSETKRSVQPWSNDSSALSSSNNVAIQINRGSS